jgi:hypothetical protein
LRCAERHAVVAVFGRMSYSTWFWPLCVVRIAFMFLVSSQSFALAVTIRELSGIAGAFQSHSHGNEFCVLQPPAAYWQG